MAEGEVGKLNSKRSGLVILPAAVFVLGIPSLPWRPYHLFFWAVAFVLETVLICAVWPLDAD